MKLKIPLLDALGGLLATAAVRHWMATLDYRVAYYDPSIDPAYPECQGQKIYIFWHEYILFPFFHRGHCNVAMLVSWHQDAEILRHAARHMGFDVVRGSSRRGGTIALRQLLDKSRRMHLAITPDGPRGPRRRLSPGPAYLASKLGLPIVAMGFGYHRPWRAPTWDRFALPRPGSRARAILSPPLYVPPELDREGLEHFRGRIEVLLNRLTEEAESWAETNTRKVGQQPIHRGPQRSCFPRKAAGERQERSGRPRLYLPPGCGGATEAA